MKTHPFAFSLAAGYLAFAEMILPAGAQTFAPPPTAPAADQSDQKRGNNDTLTVLAVGALAGGVALMAGGGHGHSDSSVVSTGPALAPQVLFTQSASPAPKSKAAAPTLSPKPALVVVGSFASTGPSQTVAAPPATSTTPTPVTTLTRQPVAVATTPPVMTLTPPTVVFTAPSPAAAPVGFTPPPQPKPLSPSQGDFRSPLNLTPPAPAVPEPGTLASFSLGVLLLAGGLLRARRAARSGIV